MTKGRLPNFICIGAPRSGTTWLHYCLDTHPESFVPIGKELQFFIIDSYRSTFHKGIEWYKSHFNFECNNYKVWGELSPRYYFLENTPKLICSIIPDTKIIYLLRHPVEVLHSLSAYHLKMYPQAIDGSRYGFHDYIDHHLTEPLCLYAKYYRRYSKYFSKNRIYIALQEDIKGNSVKKFAEICKFLEIRSDLDFSFSKNKINSPVVKKSFLLSLILKRLSVYSKIFNKIDSRYNNINFYDWSGSKRSLVTPEQFIKLVNIYREDIHELESIINRDLSHWFKYDTLNKLIRYY